MFTPCTHIHPHTHPLTHSHTHTHAHLFATSNSHTRTATRPDMCTSSMLSFSFQFNSTLFKQLSVLDEAAQREKKPITESHRNIFSTDQRFKTFLDIFFFVLILSFKSHFLQITFSLKTQFQEFCQKAKF